MVATTERRTVTALADLPATVKAFWADQPEQILDAGILERLCDEIVAQTEESLFFNHNRKNSYSICYDISWAQEYLKNKDLYQVMCTLLGPVWQAWNQIDPFEYKTPTRDDVSIWQPLGWVFGEIPKNDSWRQQKISLVYENFLWLFKIVASYLETATKSETLVVQQVGEQILDYHKIAEVDWNRAIFAAISYAYVFASATIWMGSGRNSRDEF